MFRCVCFVVLGFHFLERKAILISFPSHTRHAIQQSPASNSHHSAPLSLSSFISLACNKPLSQSSRNPDDHSLAHDMSVCVTWTSDDVIVSRGLRLFLKEREESPLSPSASLTTRCTRDKRTGNSLSSRKRGFGMTMMMNLHSIPCLLSFPGKKGGRSRDSSSRVNRRMVSSPHSRACNRQDERHSHSLISLDRTHKLPPLSQSALLCTHTHNCRRDTHIP